MVYVMLANGFEEIEALSVVDILKRGGCEVYTVSISEDKKIIGSHNINIIADLTIGDITNDFDALVLPGGIPGTLNLKTSNKLEEVILYANNNNKLLCAICAAPMILGELGLLVDKSSTCYPSFEVHLKGCKFSENRVCIDGNIITSRGAGTAHDFAFEILKILKSEEISNNVRKSMLYDV